MDINLVFFQLRLLWLWLHMQLCCLRSDTSNLAEPGNQNQKQELTSIFFQELCKEGLCSC